MGLKTSREEVNFNTLRPGDIVKYTTPPRRVVGTTYSECFLLLRKNTHTSSCPLRADGVIIVSWFCLLFSPNDPSYKSSVMAWDFRDEDKVSWDISLLIRGPEE